MKIGSLLFKNLLSVMFMVLNGRCFKGKFGNFYPNKDP